MVGLDLLVHLVVGLCIKDGLVEVLYLVVVLLVRHVLVVGHLVLLAHLDLLGLSTIHCRLVVLLEAQLYFHSSISLPLT